MKPLRVLFVTEYYPPHIGGVETFFYELRKALIEKGVHVDVVTTSQAGAPHIEKDSGGTIQRVKVPQSGDRYAFSFAAIPAVMKLAKKADLIHATTYNAIPPAWLVSKILRKKTVLTVHEVLGRRWTEVFPKNPLKSTVFRVFEDTLLALPFNRVVAVSKASQNDLPARMKRKSSVIHHGIDPMFSPASSSASLKKAFLFYGRAAAQKGLWLLLDALEDFYRNPINQRDVSFELIVSGSEMELKKVREKLDKKSLNSLSLNSFVRILPSLPQKDLLKHIQSARAVVVPSLSEGFGFTTAEAVACHTPVIVSDAGSLPEIVGGKHLIFKAGQKRSLLRALEKAVKNQWDYKKAQDFSWARAAEEYEAVYRKLMD